MNKSIITILFLGSLWLTANAQKNDYIWLTGYESAPSSYDSGCQCGFGISKFDFNRTPVALTSDSLGINFYRANSVISDSLGNLLFYSNGVEVRNSLDQIIENGDSLGYGPEFTSIYPGSFYQGLPFPESSLSLPNPAKENVYDIFYGYVDTMVEKDEDYKFSLLISTGFFTGLRIPDP